MSSLSISVVIIVALIGFIVGMFLAAWLVRPTHRYW